MILDNITYIHRLSNFIEAKNQALKLAGLLKKRHENGKRTPSAVC